ncbi:hypothetical protein CCY99_03465 [Helicobacter sp. 16-1353]|nr:hypothetical protein CCY99_03465 [Helicobacter sp. 16-1353]
MQKINLKRKRLKKKAGVLNLILGYGGGSFPNLPPPHPNSQCKYKFKNLDLVQLIKDNSIGKIIEYLIRNY